MQGILRAKILSRLGLTSNGDASLTMRLRKVLVNPLSFRRGGRRDQIVRCFERQHIVALPEYLCLASAANILSGLEVPSGVSIGLSKRVFNKSNVRRVHNPPAKDAWVQFVCFAVTWIFWQLWRTCGQNLVVCPIESATADLCCTWTVSLAMCQVVPSLFSCWMQMVTRACRWFSQRFGVLFQVMQLDPAFHSEKI